MCNIGKSELRVPQLMQQSPIFRPGIIVGNAHTPAWVRLVGKPRAWAVRQYRSARILGRSIAAEIALHSRRTGEVIRENTAMKELATKLFAEI
jgi:hypothetical protein